VDTRRADDLRPRHAHRHGSSNRSFCYRIRGREIAIQPHLDALADAEPSCFWLDQADRPAALAALEGDEVADLLIVGGGFTGLWAALQAKEENPDRDVLLLEGGSIATGASGRNGGFADPSLTHGIFNGLHHFPNEMDTIEKLGLENYHGYLESLERHGIDARVEQTGALSVATAPYQVEDLREYHAVRERFGEEAQWLDRDAVRAELDSPTYEAGVWRRSGAIVDPARTAWGLAETAQRLGVRIYEQTGVTGLRPSRAGIDVRTGSGRVRAHKVVLATNAYRSPLRRMRRSTIAVWDYALMSEPLSSVQLASIGWERRQGTGDSANQFHYYRLTVDDRILWGGYDAVYHFGNRIQPSHEQCRESFEGLSSRFFQTFPQLEGLRFTHTWGGPIATTTRFCLNVGSAFERRVSWATGYTGLGVVASRFGARVALDLLDQPNAPRLASSLVRKSPFPWPPEPFVSIAVELTQRALAKADRNEGHRGLWLRLLDGLGLGFDS
jgi:glycine/D-amino acid oxidase-like deaminating enzyme